MNPIKFRWFLFKRDTKRKIRKLIYGQELLDSEHRLMLAIRNIDSSSYMVAYHGGHVVKYMYILYWIGCLEYREKPYYTPLTLPIDKWEGYENL